jgi:predicted  nucleic acid-binding Zn-ribbon protein
MTRKEPQFNDDLNTPIAVTDPKELVRPDLKPETQRTPRVQNLNQTGSNWLLWMFVIVSLFVSFGMAFFGLEEAGRYQAALTQAESQAKELEATIQRLNESQTQGIGELAQSDAQMRKMVQSVEARLKSDVTKDLEALSKQVKSLQQDVKNSDASSKAVQLKLDESVALLSEQINTERTRIDASSKAVQSKLDESVALLSEQINTERTRIDAVSGTRQAVMALSEELRALKEAYTTLNGSLQQVSIGQAATEQTVKDIQLVVEGINEQLAQLETANNALIGLEVLSEQVDRLAQQAKQQQQVIDAVDASRKQLTQRIIDLDGRVNLALSPKEQ